MSCVIIPFVHLFDALYIYTVNYFLLHSCAFMHLLLVYRKRVYNHLHLSFITVMLATYFSHARGSAGVFSSLFANCSFEAQPLPLLGMPLQNWRLPLWEDAWLTMPNVLLLTSVPPGTCLETGPGSQGGHFAVTLTLCSRYSQRAPRAKQDWEPPLE